MEKFNGICLENGTKPFIVESHRLLNAFGGQVRTSFLPSYTKYLSIEKVWALCQCLFYIPNIYVPKMWALQNGPVCTVSYTGTTFEVCKIQKCVCSNVQSTRSFLLCPILSF